MVDAVLGVFKRYSDDDGGSYAAALTYYVFFSIFPLLSFAAAVLGYATLHNPELEQRIITNGFEAFPLLGQVLTPDAVHAAQTGAGGFFIVGILLALYSGTGAIVALQHALNRVDRIPMADEGNFLAKRVNSLKWLVVIGILASVSVGLGTLASFAGKIFSGTAGQLIAILLGHLFGLGIGVALFVTCFMFLTHVGHGYKEVLPGAITAAIVFEILKEVGAWYLNRGAESRAQTFGAFADAAGLLVAAYLLCQVILLAAEVNAVLAERRALRLSTATDKEGS